MKARILKKHKLYFPEVYSGNIWLGVVRGGRGLYVNTLNTDDWCWHYTLWGAKKSLLNYLKLKAPGEVVCVYGDE